MTHLAFGVKQRPMSGESYISTIYLAATLAYLHSIWLGIIYTAKK